MWLALDTATERASVALGAPGRTPLEENIGGSRRHAAALLPAIQRLLQHANASLDDLRGIVLSDGPGSFTGLRVGASVAKALVQSRGLALWTAPSLLVRAAAAAGAEPTDQLVLAVANALRGELYAAAYRFLPEGIQTEMIPSVRRPEELVESGLTPAVVIGDGPAEVVTLLERWIGRPVIGPPDSFPRAALLFTLIGRNGGARRVEAISGWEPLYGRPAEAQVRWETVHGRPLPDSVGSPG